MTTICSEMVTGASAWLGPDIAKDRSWIVEFTPRELAELDAALARAKARDTALPGIRREDFLLPTLGPKLV